MLWNYIENFQNVIWDWNGTLLNDHEAAWKAECRLFSSLGREPLCVNERRKLFTMPVQLYYERLGFDFTQDNFEELSHQWFVHYEEEIKHVGLFEGTHELLGKVVENGKQQFILSASPQDHLDDCIAKNSLNNYFHGVYGLDSKRADCKRERGRELLRKHNLEPRNSLVIGDTVHDAEVAETLGCSVLLVADGHQDYEVLLAKTKSVLRSRY